MVAVVLTKSKKDCISNNNISILQVNENYKNSFLRSSHPEMLLRKDAANLQENTHVKV